MNLRLLLLLVLTAFAFQSCQSEYGERMSKAIALKRKYEAVQAQLMDDDVKIQLADIEKEIKFHATLSGNESLFLEQIWNN